MKAPENLDLSSVEPTSRAAVLDFIDERCLDIFVDSRNRVFYRMSALENDPSFRRALLEVGGLVRNDDESGVAPKFIALPTANWDSLSAAVSGAPEAAVSDLPDIEPSEIVAQLIDSAIDADASDLHIATNRQTAKTDVRFRINGVLTRRDVWDYKTGDKLLRAIWNLHERVQRAEDGINNASYYHRHAASGKLWMVRMTETPEVRGIKFVARLRDPEHVRPLEDSGYSAAHLRVLRTLTECRSGLISINGPTNSGKSSTQSAILSQMPQEMNIIEIGDPIETTLPHVTHIELRESHKDGKEGHLDEILSSSVRQDTDLLALTEMRDGLTAKAALQLVSQGKMVITTMHTTDFVTSFERLLRFGIPADDILTPGFLRGFVSQRLLSRLCPACVLEEPPQEKANAPARWRMLFPNEDVSGVRYRNRSGCTACNHTGIVARTLAAEAVEFSNDVMPLARAILRDGDPKPWYAYAKENKILSIHQHAAQRVLRGEVDPLSVEGEIGRFTPANLSWHSAAPAAVSQLPPGRRRV